MTTIRYKKVTETTVTKEIPDHFSYDDSPRGKVVDILLGEPSRRHGSKREQLYSDDALMVESAIYDLTRAYETATEIVKVFCKEPSNLDV